jgi:hypothetical protein
MDVILNKHASTTYTHTHTSYMDKYIHTDIQTHTHRQAQTHTQCMHIILNTGTPVPTFMLQTPF